jgi:hypothetical protein
MATAPRTFRFYGLGYGNSNVSITATVANTVVFSGEIPTVNQPIAPFPPYDPDDYQILFTIDNSEEFNTEFAGSVPASVTVNGGEAALFTTVTSNYQSGNPLLDPTLSSPDYFGISYWGVPPNSDGTQDERSSVEIDGVPQPRQPDPESTWVWLVPAGSTMTYNWNIGRGGADRPS